MTATTEQHAAHHIKQWVPLPRNLDGKILFTDLSQGIVPDSDVSDVCRIVRSELTEEVRAAPLDGQEQHVQEVEQREGRIYANVGAGAAHILHAKGRVGGRQARGEDEQRLVRTAEISGQEVGKDGAGRIDGRRVRLVMGVPLVLEFRQSLCRFRGSQD